MALAAMVALFVLQPTPERQAEVEGEAVGATAPAAVPPVVYQADDIRGERVFRPAREATSTWTADDQPLVEKSPVKLRPSKKEAIRVRHRPRPGEARKPDVIVTVTEVAPDQPVDAERASRSTRRTRRSPASRRRRLPHPRLKFRSRFLPTVRSPSGFPLHDPHVVRIAPPVCLWNRRFIQRVLLYDGQPAGDTQRDHAV